MWKLHMIWKTQSFEMDFLCTNWQTNNNFLFLYSLLKIVIFYKWLLVFHVGFLYCNISSNRKYIFFFFCSLLKQYRPSVLIKCMFSWIFNTIFSFSILYNFGKWGKINYTNKKDILWHGGSFWIIESKSEEWFHYVLSYTPHFKPQGLHAFNDFTLPLIHSTSLHWWYHNYSSSYNAGRTLSKVQWQCTYEVIALLFLQLV